MCHEKIGNLRTYRTHFQLFHSDIHNFLCPVTNCGRSYTLFNSFRRHYVRNHSQPNDNGDNDTNPTEPSSQPSVEAVEGGLELLSVQSSQDSASQTPSVSDALSEEKGAYQQLVSEKLELLFANLYAKPNLPINVVDTVFCAFKDILNDSLLPAIKVTNNKLASDIKRDLMKFSSHYKRLLHYKQIGTFVVPETFVVGHRYDFVKKSNGNFYQSVNSVAQKIPLREILYKLFSLENLLTETIHNVNEIMLDSSGSTLRHVMHGSMWKKKVAARKPTDIIFPLIIFQDDFECLNPIGSSSGIHKLGAVYMSLPCLPSRLTSLLSNIFLILLYHSSDRVQFGNRIIFQPVIDQLNDLSINGIHFNRPDFTGTIYFELAFILGDNLGLHSILGFVESFSCTYPCRACKVEKSVMKSQFFEDKSLLRDMNNYEADVKLNNCSLTGVKERCVWLDVHNFELFSQTSYDVLHDASEGWCKYILSSLIVVLIDKLKYFTIDALNNKIAGFNYGPDNRDKPVQLSMVNLRKGNLRLNAAEMNSFVKYFGVMVGDCVPQNDKYWQIYIVLCDVLTLVFSNSFSLSQVTSFNDMAAKLCEMYTTLFQVTLKPKFHNLLHYSSAILRSGPLRYISSMRYEAKHRPSKIAAKSTANRINMTLTLARKQQLYLNELFLKRKIPSRISFSKKIGKQALHCDVIPAAESLGFNDSKKLLVVTWATDGCNEYRNGSTVVDRDLSGDIFFAKINNIYVYDKTNIILEVTPFVTRSFDRHRYAYHVQWDPFEDAVYLDQKRMPYPFLCNTIPLTCGYDELPQSYVVLRRPL